MILKQVLLLLTIVFCIGCNNTRWLNEPPDEFLGHFAQVSDGIIQGYEEPILLSISKKSFDYFSPGDQSNHHLPILKVSLTHKKIVIFCGEKNDNFIASDRFELFWSKNNYLIVSSIVPTGIDNNDA